MIDIIRVGFIDSVTIGCVASDVVLYVALAVIIGVVVLRFIMAVVFGWFLSWKIGRFPNETPEQRRARSAEIENWTDDIYRPAAARYRPNVANKRKTMLPTTSRFSKGDALLSPTGTAISSGTSNGNSRPESKFGDYRKSMLGAGMRNSPPGSPKASRSSTSLPGSYSVSPHNRSSKIVLTKFFLLLRFIGLRETNGRWNYGSLSFPSRRRCTSTFSRL